MKRCIPLLTIIISLSFFLASCEDDTIQPSDVASTLESAQWKVAYMKDTDGERTSSFTDYQFTFTATPGTSPASGLVEASNGSTDVVGSWSTGYIGESAKLKLSFSLSPFNTLSKDWEVTELSSTTIKLKQGGDVSLTLQSL